MDLGIEWVLRCKAMELESLRCIVSRLERVVVVRPTHPSPHIYIYIYIEREREREYYEHTDIDL